MFELLTKRYLIINYLAHLDIPTPATKESLQVNDRRAFYPSYYE